MRAVAFTKQERGASHPSPRPLGEAQTRVLAAIVAHETVFGSGPTPVKLAVFLGMNADAVRSAIVKLRDKILVISTPRGLRATEQGLRMVGVR